MKHHSLPSLLDAGLKHFKSLIFDEVKRDVANAMLDLINQVITKYSAYSAYSAYNAYPHPPHPTPPHHHL